MLVGGLVPRYICGDISAPRLLPRPVTIDADMGIALGASAGGMSILQFALLEKDFRKTTSPEGLIRYEKKIGDYSVPVDFLTDALSSGRIIKSDVGTEWLQDVKLKSTLYF